MTIGKLYKYVWNLPSMINLIRSDDSHPWIGDISDAPEWVLDTEFNNAYVYTNCDKPQVVFHI